MRRLHLTGERGFTLVEILVIVLIVAVLAAIAFPLYLNQRTKAQDAEARAAATTAAKALMVWYQDTGTYDGAGVAELAGYEPTLAQARGLVVSGTDDSYLVLVASAAGTVGGGPFTIQHDPTGTVRSCPGAGRGGCPTGGLW